MEEVSTYKQYVGIVMSFYKGCREGEGLFLFRTLMAKYGKYPEKYRLIIYTAFNLISTGYLQYKEDADFVVLTLKGCDSLNGEPMEYNEVNLNVLIDQTIPSEYRFDELWRIIGVKGKALFYVPGHIYYNTIKPYIKDLHQSYSLYVDTLQKTGESTSRIKWYRNLYAKLNDADLTSFLQDLSVAIKNIPETTNAIPLSARDSSTNQKTKKKTVFISYCWEGDEHEQWVHRLAEDLSQYFEIKIDVSQPLGTELNKFMEQMIRESDKVLIIASPEYKHRADSRLRGVGYETSLITDDLINDQNRIKFIPIIRKGTKSQSYPVYLGNRKGLDMTNDNQYNDSLKTLIENLQNY